MARECSGFCGSLPGWRHPAFRATNGASVAVRVSLANTQNPLREERAQNVPEREVRQRGRRTATCETVGQGKRGLSERAAAALSQRRDLGSEGRGGAGG